MTPHWGRAHPPWRADDSGVVGPSCKRGKNPNQLSRSGQRGEGNVFISCLYLPGRGGAQLKRYKPVCPPKPADLVQRTKLQGGRMSLPNLTPASSALSLASSASSTSGHSSIRSRVLLHRRRAVIPDTVKLPPGVLSLSASSPPTPPGNSAFNYSRRKDNPGRRKDGTQSLYIGDPECNMVLHFSSCPPSTSSSSTSIVAPATVGQNHDPQASKGQRCFSDLDIPYMDEDVWEGRCSICSDWNQSYKIKRRTGLNFASTFSTVLILIALLYQQCSFSFISPRLC